MPIPKLTNETAVQCSPAQCAENEINGTSVHGGADTYTLCGCESSGGIADVAALLKNMAPLILFGAVKEKGSGGSAEEYLKGYAAQIEKMPKGERKAAYEHLAFSYENLARSVNGISAAIGHYEEAIEAYKKAGGQETKIAYLYREIFDMNGVSKSKQKEILRKAYEGGLWEGYEVLDEAKLIQDHDMVAMVYSDMLKNGDGLNLDDPNPIDVTLDSAIKYFEALPFKGVVPDRQIYILQEILNISPKELGTISKRYLKKVQEQREKGYDAKEYRCLCIRALELQMRYYLVMGKMKKAVDSYRSISRTIPLLKRYPQEPSSELSNIKDVAKQRLTSAFQNNVMVWVQNWLEARIEGWSKMPETIKRPYIAAAVKLTKQGFNDFEDSVNERLQAFLNEEAFEAMMDKSWREAQLPTFTAKPQSSQSRFGAARSGGVEGPAGAERSTAVKRAEVIERAGKGRDGKEDGRKTETGKKAPKGPGRIK